MVVCIVLGWELYLYLLKGKNSVEVVVLLVFVEYLMWVWEVMVGVVNVGGIGGVVWL